MSNPFAHLVDEPAAGPREAVTELLDSAKRGYVPLRKSFVQWPSDHPTRPNQLALFVTGRQERALDALLLIHALEPVLEGSPLPLGTWARALSATKPCTSSAASAAFHTLSEWGLIVRGGTKAVPEVRPLMEDGSRQPWHRAGSDPGTVGKGYFVIPHDYWTTGLSAQLRLPGKAMLLIMLAETSKEPSFSMAVERAQEWYGVSERTAERGYVELSKAGLLRVHRQLVADARHPLGRRPVYHRALVTPFSTDARAALQKASRAPAQQASTGGASTPAKARGGR